MRPLDLQILDLVLESELRWQVGHDFDLKHDSCNYVEVLFIRYMKFQCSISPGFKLALVVS